MTRRTIRRFLLWALDATKPKYVPPDPPRIVAFSSTLQIIDDAYNHYTKPLNEAIAEWDWEATTDGL
jgi:hypothetical protein